jgi:hypothetical protein
MYIDSLNSIFDAGKVSSHPPLTIFYWVHSADKKVCPECLLLGRFSPYTRDTLPCLVGDTKIPLLDGRIEEIRNIKAGDQVYSCTPKGDVVIGVVEKCLLVGESDTITIWLDNFEKITCTLDHPFLMRDGTYKNANELEIGDSLMPFCLNECKVHLKTNPNVGFRGAWKKLEFRVMMNSLRDPKTGRIRSKKDVNHKVIWIEYEGKKPVYDLVVEPWHNFGLLAGCFTHNTTPRSGASRCLSNCRCRLYSKVVSETEYQKVHSINYSKKYFLDLLRKSRNNQLPKYYYES